MKKLISLCIALLLIVLVLSACGSKNDIREAAPLAQGHWVGSWQGLDSSNDEKFTVNISDNYVEIVWLLSSGKTALYWAGTFPQIGSEDVVSAVDVEILEKSFFASEDLTKTFVYNDGTLVFDATFVGVTKSIHLDK